MSMHYNKISGKNILKVWCKKVYIVYLAPNL